MPVCNPSHTSLVDVYKIIRYGNLLGAWTRGLVVNRVGKKAEIPTSEIEQFMGRTLGNIPVLAEIPEDSKVQEAELEGIPVVVYEPDCKASIAINELAKFVAGEADLPYASRGESDVKETTRRLIQALTGRRA